MAEPTDDVTSRVATIFLALGFASLGLLVGSIAGLSSAQLTLPLFGFLFALVGGSVIAFLDKVPRQSVALAGIALASFSLMGTAALYGGLYIKVNEKLYVHGAPAVSDKAGAAVDKPAESAAVGYRDLLRSQVGERLEDYLKEEIATGKMSLAAACGRLGESRSSKPQSAN